MKKLKDLNVFLALMIPIGMGKSLGNIPTA